MATTFPAPCDRAIATPVRGVETPYPQLTLVATILASSLAFIDGSVANVALPAIGHSFAARAANLQWTLNAYLLPLSALLPLGGAAGGTFYLYRRVDWLCDRSKHSNLVGRSSAAGSRRSDVDAEQPRCSRNRLRW
jgi:MFS family permease